MNEKNENKASRIAAFWYTGISLGLALLFILATGGHDPVARYGGATWVFILSMIITMPLVIPFVKKKYNQ